MVIRKDILKTSQRPEFPELIFIRTNRGRFSEESAGDMTYLNNQVAELKKNNPTLISAMNEVMWGSDEEPFRYPVFLYKSGCWVLDSSYFFKKEDIKVVPVSSVRAYSPAFPITRQFEKAAQLMGLWEKQKHKCLNSFRLPELKVHEELIERFIQEYEKHKANFHILFSPYFSPDILKQIKSQYVSLSVHFKRMKKMNQCTHEVFSINANQSTPSVSCEACGLTFNYSSKENGEFWNVLGVYTSFSAKHLQLFLDKSAVLQLESHDHVQAAMQMSDLHQLFNLHQTKKEIDRIINLYEEAKSLNLHYSLDSSISDFLSFKWVFNIPRYSGYSSVHKWIQQLDLKLFNWHVEEGNQQKLHWFTEHSSSFLLTLTQTKDELYTLVMSSFQDIELPSAEEQTGMNGMDNVHLLSVLKMINDFEEKYGRTTFAEALSGKLSSYSFTGKLRKFGLDTHSEYRKLLHHSLQEVMAILDDLVKYEFLQLVGSKYPLLKLTSLGKKMYYHLLYDSDGSPAAEPLGNVSFKQFLHMVSNPLITDKAKVEYIQSRLTEKGPVFYKNLLVACDDHPSLIAYLEPFLSLFYESRYQPIFTLYQKTKKETAFSEMLGRILERKDYPHEHLAQATG